MDKNNNPQQPRNKKNTFSTIFLPLLLVVGMCLTFYFVFVKPSTGSSSIFFRLWWKINKYLAWTRSYKTSIKV